MIIKAKNKTNTTKNNSATQRISICSIILDDYFGFISIGKRLGLISLNVYLVRAEALE